MTGWTCPNCHGGFPEGVLSDGCCPWCGQPIDGSYEYEPAESIVRTKDDDNDEPEPMFGGLFG